MDLLVERDHVLDVISGADVPRFARVIEKRRIATPAVGIAVRVRLFLEKKTAGLQVRHDFRIGILEEFARIRRHGLRELAARVEGVNHREVILQRSLVVVFPVSGGHMNDAGSVACRDKVPPTTYQPLLSTGMKLNHRSYSFPMRSRPDMLATISVPSGMSERRSLVRMRNSVEPSPGRCLRPASPRGRGTFTYSTSGLTASATLEMSVQGVVVHTRKYVFSSPLIFALM